MENIREFLFLLSEKGKQVSICGETNNKKQRSNLATGTIVRVKDAGRK